MTVPFSAEPIDHGPTDGLGRERRTHDRRPSDPDVQQSGTSRPGRSGDTERQRSADRRTCCAAERWPVDALGFAGQPAVAVAPTARTSMRPLSLCNIFCVFAVLMVVFIVVPNLAAGASTVDSDT